MLSAANSTPRPSGRRNHQRSELSRRDGHDVNGQGHNTEIPGGENRSAWGPGLSWAVRVACFHASALTALVCSR